MRPFKPPTLVSRPNGAGSAHSATPSSKPPAKKRRISHENDDEVVEVTTAAANVLKKPKPLQKFQAPVRKPLEVVQNPSGTACTNSNDKATIEAYYAVLWRKFTMKKNKTWDGDGVLSVSGGYANLQDVSGKEMGRAPCKAPLLVGSELKIGGKDVEVESMISKGDFLAGRPFLGHAKAPTPSLKQVNETSKVTSKERAKYDKIAPSQKERLSAPVAKTDATKGVFKAPLLNDNVQQPTKDSRVPVPRHDRNAVGALVMKRPKKVPNGRQVVDVVVDPLFTSKNLRLREHQRVGVAFLYECVMGMRDYDGEGAILADEMGLGKTAQTIALLWTLLKQNPIYEQAPVIKKALIVCPVTLINNWRREFHKWLGKERLGVFVAKDKKARITDFTKGRAYSVMIIGYEKLRLIQEDLQKGDGIDIVIADEGHRLKTAKNKSALAIKSLSTERRIILSGTPLQNDLAEFYTMVDFVNPGLLDKYNTFKRVYETPILKSQQPEASTKDVEKGKARSEELANMTNKFILRRTAEILSDYLPPKTEYVLFCKPTAVQISVYREILESSAFGAALGSTGIALELINILKKVCNSPNLLLKKSDKGEGATKKQVLESISPSLLRSPAASGKLQVLDSLLHQIRTTTEEKVVLVSNYTSTMDILENLLNSLSYSYLRLDGTTPQNKRQEVVDRFNKSSARNFFVFLLSAKAGGTGINLIGASRLVLFDLDWNPATDQQAMARIHRDGQKRPCYIYRLLTQGVLDEKIFQRQVSKTGLAKSVVDGKSGTSEFTREELRDLFSLDENDHCQTHELLACECGGAGTSEMDQQNELETHYNGLAHSSADDELVERDEDGTEILRLDDDQELSPFKLSSLQNAKDYDWRAEEAAIERKRQEDSAGKAKMLSLMQYKHFDTSLVKSSHTPGQFSGDDRDEMDEDILAEDPLEGTIEDAALRSVLREEERRIGFVFSKMG